MQIAGLAIVVAVVLAFRALQFALLTRQIQWGYDFSAYWSAAGRLLDGLSPYDPHQLAGTYSPQQQFLYLYPPPLAAAVTPLAALFPTDYRAAAWVWTTLGAVLLVAGVLAISSVERLSARFPVLAGRGVWLLVAGALAFPPVLGELVLGNVHLLLLGLLSVAWLGVRRGDERGEWIAGAAVGVATVIKVFPGVLVLWFLLTRRYRAAAGAIVGGGLVAVLTLPVTGIEPWLQYPTVLANLGPPVDTRDTLAPTVWLADLLGFGVARIVVTVAGLAVVAWTALTVRPARATTENDPGALGRSFAIAVTVSVLIAPAVYQHYLAVLVLPLLLGLGSGVSVGWLAASYLLMWGGEQSALGDLSWIVNRAMPTLGAVLLLVGLVLGRRRGPSAARPSVHFAPDADHRPGRAPVDDDRPPGVQRGEAARPGPR